MTGQKNDDSVQTTKTQQKRQRRSQSPKKYDYIGHITSSSDDDISLANIKFRKKVILEQQQDDSDKDETFKPLARDNNSTDTEYSSNLSDTEKQDRNMKKALLKDFKDANQKEAKARQQISIQQISASAKQQQNVKKVIKDKQDMGTSKAHDCLNKEVVQPPPEQKGLSSQSNTLALIERVKSQSRREVEQQIQLSRHISNDWINYCLVMA